MNVVDIQLIINGARRTGFRGSLTRGMYLPAAVVLAVFTIAANAAELSLDHANLTPGKTADLNVRIAAGATAPTGVQFDLEYDSTAMDVRVEAGPVATASEKTLQAAVTPAGKHRVLIIGFNKNVMPDGVVAILHVTLKGEAKAGQTFPISIKSPSGTNARAESLVFTGNEGSIKVESRRNGQ